MAKADDSPASATIGNDPTDPPPSSPPSPPSPVDSTPTPSPAGPSESPPPPPAPVGIGGIALTALGVLACGLGIAFLIERYLAPPRESAPQPGSAVSTSAEPRPSRAPTAAKAPEGRDLAERLDKLSRQIEAIQKQLDAQARPGPPPEVAALQVRVADLTASTNNLAPLLSKVDHLDHRVNDLAVELTALRNDSSSPPPRPAQTPRGNSPRPTPRETSTAPTPLPDSRRTPPARPGSGLADPKALSVVADLYRRGRYKEAFDAVNPITTRSPADARVWYYAALCTGFTTRDWAVASAQLVQKGLAREEAGTPRTPEIDAEFMDLTTSNGKDWLASYRRRVNAKKPG